LIQKVLIAVLTTYERGGWLHPSILQLAADLPYIAGDKYAFRFTGAHNFQPAAAGRNVLCRQALEGELGWDWICMIDNDMAPPANLLDTIIDAPEDAGIVVPTFYLWDQVGHQVQLCWGVMEEPEPLPNGNKHLDKPFYELDKCGTGVIFIRTAALRKMTYPYFRYEYNADQGLASTEDIQFCLKAREVGIKIFGNPRIRVGHYHSVNLDVLAHLLFDEKFSIDKSKTDSVSLETTVEASPAETVEACPANQ
jgi:hypothetical protein